VNRVFKNLAIYLIIVLIAVTALRLTSTPEVQTAPFGTFSEFMDAAEAGQIKQVKIITEDNYQKIDGVTTDDRSFSIEAPKGYNGLIDVMRENKVNIDQEPTPVPPLWLSIITSLLPILLIVGIFFFVMQQGQGGGGRVMQFGKSKAKLQSEDRVKVTFKDVAGADEVKEELEEIVEFLKTPKKFVALGAKIPKGVLLYGPPGTGKTLLARAVAGEAGVPFYTISGSDFVEMFVGVGASRVRDLFEQAKKTAPCIVFIDEIDAVGRQRGAGLGGGHDEREQTLNQLLVEMDGFDANQSVIVIAATNRPDILDPALLRPGRFDRQVTVDRPDVVGREAILKVHMRNKPIAEDVDTRILAKGTPGFTGADLANLVNEGALLAARKGLKKIHMKELQQSIERVIAGPEKKSRVISEYEKNIVAYHETGHALVAAKLEHADQLHKVTIIPRGRAGGYTLFLPKEDANYVTRSQLIDKVTTLLGGRVAEQVVLKEISTGASNDLERATETIRRMITEWGMSKELGPMTFGNKKDQVFLGRDIARDRNYSEAVAFSIDKEARAMIEECYQKAEKILTENMDALVLIAETLKERETIDAKEFFALMEGKDDVFEEVDRIEKERYQQTPAEEEAAEEEANKKAKDDAKDAADVADVTEEKLPGDEVVPEDPIEKKEE
jgi:cell division protease FtsH